jgi:ribosomal-protein-alanine N-acetyltransferase
MDGTRNTFRQLGPDDLAALTKLFEENAVPEVTSSFDPFPLTKGTAEDLLRPGRADQFYGAFDDGRLVAFSMLRGWDEGYEIPSFGIFVDAGSHGHGVGARLTEWTIEQARLADAPSVRLSVYASNERAIHIYSRLGFEVESRTRVERDGQLDEKLVMNRSFATRR